MKHATYDFEPKSKTQTLTTPKSRTKTPSSFMSLLAIHIAPLDPLDSIFLFVSSNPLATLGANTRFLWIQPGFLWMWFRFQWM